MNEKDLMLTSILQCRRVDLAVGSKELTGSQRSEFTAMVKRRAQGEPLQYIIGRCDFMDTSLSVDERALIPRSETELLVELAIKKIKLLRPSYPLRVLDLGTGSGNIAITLAKNIPNSLITAVDTHKGALALALKNARDNNVEQRIEFLCRDMTEYLKEASKGSAKFDCVISNPPYIKTSALNRLPADVQREPQAALDGGEDGLKFYGPIIRYAHQVLNPRGLFLLEIGDGQSGQIETMFEQYPQYEDIGFHKDYVGTDRMVTAHLDK